LIDRLQLRGVFAQKTSPNQFKADLVEAAQFHLKNSLVVTNDESASIIEAEAVPTETLQTDAPQTEATAIPAKPVNTVNPEAPVSPVKPATEVFQFNEGLLKQLRIISKKSEQLQNNGHLAAADASIKLLTQIISVYVQYTKGAINQDELVAASKLAIEEARIELEKHRGWTHALGNLASAIPGLGEGSVFSGLFKHSATNKNRFFRTASAIELDKLSEEIKSIQISTAA
jgi:hypothetical protein